MKAIDVLEELGIEECRECGCPVGDDWKFKDFSNKTIIVCPQCGEEYDITKEEERKSNDICITEKAMDGFIERIRFLWHDEPLDGDETENIAKIILAKLDYANGNITEKEYMELVKSRLQEIKEIEENFIYS